MIINCIVVDDEPLAIEILEDYIKKVPFLKQLNSFSNPFKALEFLGKTQVDIIFLDIQMDELNGLQFIKVLKNKPEIVLTTAYDKFAIEGFELDVADYLLKPISFERFIKSVEKVYEKVCMKNSPKTVLSETLLPNHQNDYFFVKTEFRLQKVNFNDILYIEGQGDYLKIVTPTEVIMTLQNFKNIEEVLPQNRFVRIHRSYIVSLSKIISIERNHVKIGEKLLPIGDNYKKPFYKILEDNKMM